jgi:hypothetical protein
MGPPLKTSPKRIGHTYVTAFGDSVLLAERDEVQQVAEAPKSSTLAGTWRTWATLPETMDDATRPVVTQ